MTTRARAARRSTEPPTTITVNLLPRTIVRDVDDALPTILAGLALLVALAPAGFALIRTRSLQRTVIGRSDAHAVPSPALACDDGGTGNVRTRTTFLSQITLSRRRLQCPRLIVCSSARP